MCLSNFLFFFFFYYIFFFFCVFNFLINKLILKFLFLFIWFFPFFFRQMPHYNHYEMIHTRHLFVIMKSNYQILNINK